MSKINVSKLLELLNSLLKLDTIIFYELLNEEKWIYFY